MKNTIIKYKQNVGVPNVYVNHLMQQHGFDFEFIEDTIIFDRELKYTTLVHINQLTMVEITKDCV